MKPFDPETFGDLNAHDYDERNDPGTTEAAVRLLAGLYGTSRVVELAIGTGRIALPLAAAGVDVAGIEGSPLMVEKLREKPGGSDIPVVTGDMASFTLADFSDTRPLDHAFLVFNTLYNLQTQNAQLGCFQSVSNCLAIGGTFLVEAFVPDFAGYSNGQRVGIKQMEHNLLWLDAVQHDPVEQLLEYQRVRLAEDGLRFVPLRLRYVWPAELDLMARLSGMRLVERWGGWGKDPFDRNSRMHVSLYEKVGG